MFIDDYSKQITVQWIEQEIEYLMSWRGVTLLLLNRSGNQLIFIIKMSLYKFEINAQI